MTLIWRDQAESTVGKDSGLLGDFKSIGTRSLPGTPNPRAPHQKQSTAKHDPVATKN
jgi:hypothetical protein